MVHSGKSKIKFHSRSELVQLLLREIQSQSHENETKLVTGPDSRQEVNIINNNSDEVIKIVKLELGNYCVGILTMFCQAAANTSNKPFQNKNDLFT